MNDFTIAEQLVARDIRQTELESEMLVAKRAETMGVRDFPIHKAIQNIDAQLHDLAVQYRTLRGVGAYLGGLRGFTGPTVVEDWLAAVWEQQVGAHPAVELTGGSIPSHVPGSYPKLSCCGGDIQLVDSPAGAGESVEASRG